jgi:mono/diheme cytochrome c family protein
MKFILSIILIVIIFSGCYYDKAELTYPANTSVTCDTSAVKYSVDILSIMSANCNSCHSGTATSGGGIKLDSYTGLKTYATNGQLLNSLLQNGIVAAMPQGGAKLSDCDINKVRSWINNGTPNN